MYDDVSPPLAWAVLCSNVVSPSMCISDKWENIAPANSRRGALYSEIAYTEKMQLTVCNFNIEIRSEPDDIYIYVIYLRQ